MGSLRVTFLPPLSHRFIFFTTQFMVIQEEKKHFFSRLFNLKSAVKKYKFNYVKFQTFCMNYLKRDHNVTFIHKLGLKCFLQTLLARLTSLHFGSVEKKKDKQVVPCFFIAKRYTNILSPRLKV